MREPRIRVLGTAAGGAEAVRTGRERCPSVVFTDVRMPGMNGPGLVVPGAAER